jgi:hypothetical protein
VVLKIPISAKSKARLKARAEQAGLTPERYVKHLVDEDLALEQTAQTTSFEELLAPVREQFRQSGMTGDELDALIERAKTRYRERARRSKTTGQRRSTNDRGSTH